MKIFNCKHEWAHFHENAPRCCHLCGEYEGLVPYQRKQLAVIAGFVLLVMLGVSSAVYWTAKIWAG